MTKWDKFKRWWNFTGQKYFARTIVILVLLGLITIVAYPNPFSWGVLFTRLGMIFGTLLVGILFMWAIHSVE